jgi:leucyl aminopeptidase
MPLKISLRAGSPHEVPADLVVVGVWALSPASPASSRDARKAARAAGAGGSLGPLESLDRALGGGLAKLIAKEEFTGKRDQQLSVPTMGRLPADRVIVVGLGDKGSFGPREQRAFSARAARSANHDKATSLVLGLPDGLKPDFRALGEGLELGAYRFVKYYSGDRKPKANLATVTLVTGAASAAKDELSSLTLGQEIAAAVNLSRDLSNEPPNVIYPETLADAAVALGGKGSPIKVTVFDFKEIQRRGMKLIQAVGQGSVKEPRFVHMVYTPAGSNAGAPKRKVAVVGKGVTFDTGGISIKPAASMGEMKHDMSGAANVIGLMAAVAAVKPDCEVHGIFSAVENMPDGNAYRPGDVWGSLDGRSVEIINTDAEGRLILADALTYAKDLKPDLIIDNATLTGACLVALGTTCTGWYANGDSAAAEFQAAITDSGEQMWRMPLLEELKEQMKSDVADLKHTGDRWGGSITAALFLREFIGDCRWVHADIAGPATSDRAHSWIPKGGTGHGVLTFLSLVENATKHPVPTTKATPSATNVEAAGGKYKGNKGGKNRPRKYG